VNALAALLVADAREPGARGPVDGDLRRLHARLYEAGLQALGAALPDPPTVADTASLGSLSSARARPDPPAGAAVPGAPDLAGRAAPAAAWAADYPPGPGAPAAPAPDDAWRDELDRRVGERAGRPRQALRERALFALSRGRFEAALRDWEAAGAESADDLGHPLVAGYLRLMLGQYAEGASEVDAAVRRWDRARPFRAVRPAWALSIEGYRCYEPRPDRPFRPGEAGVAYLEIVAPGLEPAGAALQVRLAIGAALHDAAGREVWANPEFGRLTRRYRDPVREHNLALRNLAVPADAAPGAYRLTVTVRDLVRDEEAEAVLPLEVASGHLPAAAPGPGAGDPPRWAGPGAGEPASMAEAMARIRDQQREIESIKADIQRLAAGRGADGHAAVAALLSRGAGPLY